MEHTQIQNNTWNTFRILCDDCKLRRSRITLWDKGEDNKYVPNEQVLCGTIAIQRLRPIVKIAPYQQPYQVCNRFESV